MKTLPQPVLWVPGKASGPLEAGPWPFPFLDVGKRDKGSIKERRVSHIGCFGRKIHGPGSPGGLIIYQGNPSISNLKGHGQPQIGTFAESQRPVERSSSQLAMKAGLVQHPFFESATWPARSKRGWGSFGMCHMWTPNMESLKCLECPKPTFGPFSVRPFWFPCLVMAPKG